MRGLRLARLTPSEIFAGRPALFGLTLTNTKRWLSAYSIALESPPVAGGGVRVSYVPKLDPGQETLVTTEETLPRRGRHQLPRVRVVTRFPFGLFLKASRPLLRQEVLVYPAVRPLTPEDLRGLEGDGSQPRRKVGQGADLHNLRDYRWGDDPRLIHWKSSAKTNRPVVRELEAEAALAVRLVLEPAPGPAQPDRVEGALSWAASLAAHLIAEGGQVELVGPGLNVQRGSGPAQLRRILEALALFDSDAGGGPGAPEATRATPHAGSLRPLESPVRVIRISLGGSAAG
ncbi:MAG: DUF58 domain-containing protein [Candidatus Rokubacteria bacterium]|nr:DUF58 domain-containing protein [Candidatus Rokubacteria bacterium]